MHRDATTEAPEVAEHVDLYLAAAQQVADAEQQSVQQLESIGVTTLSLVGHPEATRRQQVAYVWVVVASYAELLVFAVPSVQTILA